ncbi:MAG: hypothetical protein ABSA11_10460 [Candidatus Bathyarchaeia archaeon]|jgi:DNA-binding PadR family transcriptional regulator
MVSVVRDEILQILLEEGPQNKYRLSDKKHYLASSSVYDQIRKLVELKYIEVSEEKSSQRSQRIQTKYYKLTFYGLQYLVKNKKVKPEVAGDRRRGRSIEFPMDFGQDKTSIIIKGDYEKNLPKMLDLIEKYDSRDFYEYLNEIDFKTHFLPAIVHLYFAFTFATIKLTENDKNEAKKLAKEYDHLRSTDREFSQFIIKNAKLIKI